MRMVASVRSAWRAQVVEVVLHLFIEDGHG